MMKSGIMFPLVAVAVMSATITLVNAGYVATPAVYGAHYGYSPVVPVVKSLSSVAVAHAPLATSYANTYKFSHPSLVVKHPPPLVKHYAPHYYYQSPVYAAYDYGYDYPHHHNLYSPYYSYLHK